ncbi:RNA polymerase sigma-70 factor, ECF subfamily [Pedobacter hartonius]|uniref:RNA polymerase sigma-70 factor, ECF subfamily n=1 Tax=Pedobacter hartonius TaxID=425514 RepID=A0A1H4GJ93_9SPHI|nr:RNA polymerase sigma-70 factor, ECF subfamily [Pedobacter hartonius]
MQTDQPLIVQDTSDFNLEGQRFDLVYTEHYVSLFKYAYTMVNDEVLAEEMVHQVFLRILEKNGSVTISTSLRSYLYRSVHNECLNHIKHEKVKDAHIAGTNAGLNYHTETPSGTMQYKELKFQLQAAINELPEQCRTIFQMSRFDELKYAEIALELGISIKTVENQIGKALKRLRVQLADYLPFILWFLLNILLLKR